MPWFKVDDGFPNSRPVLRIPRRHRASAIGLWTLAGTWSAKELTDGNIEMHLLDEFASTPAMAGQLVKCGLWEEAENGWRFRNWERYQPTREQVMADREREAERKRAYRASKRSPSGTPTGRTVGHQAESGHPDPTRPDPTRPVEPKGSTETAIVVRSDGDFEAFWDAYDKKVGKGAAEKAWTKARKSTNAAELITAAAKHADWHRRANTEARFIPHAATWLNEKRWADERPDPSTATSRDPKQAATDDMFDAAMQRAIERERNSA